MAMARQRAAAGQRVVEQRARADIGALPDVMRERKQERHRSHEMRTEPFEHQRLLAQRFADEAELELLEVAQAAVDQLRRAARGPGSPVALLDQRDREPAARRVEGGAGADDAAADHDEVEFVALPRVFEIARTLRGIESRRIHRLVPLGKQGPDARAGT